MAEYSGIPVAMVADKKSHVMKIDGYSRTKELLKTGEHATSARFSVGGHYWVIHYLPNGSMYPESITFHLVLDSYVGKAVKAECKFSILDKDGEPVDSLSRSSNTLTFYCKGTGWGYAMKKTDLEVHLRDDCFSVRCDVSVFNADVSTEKKSAADHLVLVPPRHLSRDLSDLLTSKEGADVTFQVGGESFPAHRLMLAARSSVFKAELFGAMKENSAGPIEIRDMEADVFKSLLRFIYTDSLVEGEEPEDVAMAGHLLVAADRYNIERLKLICERKLSNNIDPTMVATSLALAEQHSCHALKEACLQFLTSPSNLERMKASDGYSHLKSSCPTLLKEIIVRLLPPELKVAKDIIMEI